MSIPIAGISELLYSENFMFTGHRSGSGLNFSIIVNFV